MATELDNPFSVTKATEFSDLEINEYWVNFNPKEDVSIEAVLNPSEFLPKYIIGGKGCGKTHILRYFSFPLQKIRNQDNLSKILTHDKYIGLYSILGALNSTRFNGKGIDDSQWESIFEYYFELYLCDNLLHTIQEIILILKLDISVEEKLIQNILTKFINYKEIKGVTTISNLIEFLNELRRKIDSQVLNAAFTRKLNYEEVKVLFTPGDLLFGIPNSISNCISIFNNVKFIYILDEYEKLYEWQKKFVNTLVWDKKTPVTFWVGARRYGYTTRETKSGQEMKSGSEFQDVNLDSIIRSNSHLYKQFAERLYANRLIKYYELRGNIPNYASKSFCERFEKYDDSKIIDEIIEKNKKREYCHFREFRKKISSAIKLKLALEITDDNQIESIVESIKENTDNNPLEQKYKLFLFYKLWYNAGKKDTFKSILKTVNEEYSKFKEKTKSEFDEIKDKRKKDFIAQLTKENKVKNTEYSGIDNFIELSEGNVRSFILMLKKTIEFSMIRGEKPLEEGGKISLDSQYLAVYDTAKWFYEDAELIGSKGLQAYKSIKYLTDYFVQERFCDKPVETTASCFYIKAEELSESAIFCIELLKVHAMIIENDSGRLEKNSGRKERLFQLNKTLAPYWNLPTVVRGSIYLNRDIAEAIFNAEANSKFDSLYKLRKSQLNAPDFLKKSNGELVNPLF